MNLNKIIDKESDPHISRDTVIDKKEKIDNEGEITGMEEEENEERDKSTKIREEKAQKEAALKAKQNAAKKRQILQSPDVHITIYGRFIHFTKEDKTERIKELTRLHNDKILHQARRLPESWEENNLSAFSSSDKNKFIPPKEADLNDNCNSMGDPFHIVVKEKQPFRMVAMLLFQAKKILPETALWYDNSTKKVLPYNKFGKTLSDLGYFASMPHEFTITPIHSNAFLWETIPFYKEKIIKIIIDLLRQKEVIHKWRQAGEESKNMKLSEIIDILATTTYNKVLQIEIYPILRSMPDVFIMKADEFEEEIFVRLAHQQIDAVPRWM